MLGHWISAELASRQLNGLGSVTGFPKLKTFTARKQWIGLRCANKNGLGSVIGVLFRGNRWVSLADEIKPAGKPGIIFKAQKLIHVLLSHPQELITFAAVRGFHRRFWRFQTPDSPFVWAMCPPEDPLLQPQRLGGCLDMPSVSNLYPPFTSVASFASLRLETGARIPAWEDALYQREKTKRPPNYQCR